MWFFVLDLPVGPDGRRVRCTAEAFLPKLSPYARSASLGSSSHELTWRPMERVTAELTQWLGERELDLAVTSPADYRNAIMKYVLPHIGSR